MPPKKRSDNVHHGKSSSGTYVSGNSIAKWIGKITGFAESWLSLALSLSVLLVAFLTKQAANHQISLAPADRSVSENINLLLPAEVSAYSAYENLGSKPDLGAPLIYKINAKWARMAEARSTILNATLLDAYRNDGMICLRGLLSDDLIVQLDSETSSIIEEREAMGGPKKHSQFHTVEHSALFRNFSNASKQSVEDFPALLQAALFSNIAQVAAELLGLTAEASSRNLRVIRDIFLAKDSEEYTCGWHVDDMGFWPATPDSPGVNAWLALDDMELTEETGGFALAVQSHTAPWRSAAYYWTGASTEFPVEGYADAADMFQRRTGQGTCNLKAAAPHIHRRMEESARIYPIRRGDVIFHTRWLFHRTVPVTRTGPTNRVFRRYSIRYGPGDQTIIPPGYGTELSTLWDPSNGGKSADVISQHDGPWYPQAWPHIAIEDLPKFAKDMTTLIQEKIPIATMRRNLRIQDMRPFLRQLSKQERQDARGHSKTD